MMHLKNRSRKKMKHAVFSEASRPLFSSVCMADHRHTDSPIAKGTRRDVLLRELLPLQLVVLIDIAVSQIETGIQVSVDHMTTHLTDIVPVL